jgi:hypothetical protein
MRLRITTLGVWCAIAAFVTPPAAAQVYTGRIEVAVVDSTGAVLPGARVEISGPQDRSNITDGKGIVQFLNLAPGTYTVLVRLDGFQTHRNTDVAVVAGGSVPLKVPLNLETLAQDVFVTAESPVVDPKKTTVQTNVTLTELQEVPSSRDPWVVLQTVPGVIVDRVNVGGAESGQQSNYQAKGAAGGENTWNIDGVPITDMSALGSSPTYYDFDMFQEMQVTTGGAALNNPTPGVALNFVLKSGSNVPHGSARIYYENEDMQANNLPDDLKASIGGVTGKGNRIDEYQDHGFEVGGPLWKDRLWAWGAYGKTDVTVLTLANTPDQTILENYSFKATGQGTQNVRGSFTYFRGDKLKYGRSAGPTRPPETTWNQSGPTSLFKGEGNVVLGSNLFITGRYSYVDGGFALTPQGGLDTAMIFSDDAGIGRNSWYEYATVRPQYNTAVEGNYFTGRHELRFGFSYRTADVDSSYTVPAEGIMTYHDGYPNMIAEVTAWNHFTGTAGKYASLFAGDAITFDRLTLNLGIRWDRQSSSVQAYAQEGNSVLPNLLPDLTGQAADDVIVWNSFTPRVGFSYALTDDRKTIARGSYGTFASQLNAGAGGFFSTVGSFRGVYFYDVVDRNGNQVVDASEIAGLPVGNWYGFDITNPGNVSTPNHKVGEYDTPLTHEVLFGVDRELLPNFGVSGTFTWRNFTNHVWRPVQGLRSDDYVQLGTFSGNQAPVGAYNVPYYGVTAATMPANRTATEYIEREGYSQRYWGLELSATKRLSNRWMARFGFSTNEHTEYFDGPNSRTDPTSSPANPNIDGGQVLRQTGGSGKSGIYMLLPKYQFILTGLYQARWGINLGANMVNRQGYSMPYFRDRVATGDPLGNLKTVMLVGSVDEFRLPSMTSLDVRFGKEFTFKQTRWNVDLDVFNLLNSSTILGREYNLRLTTADTVREIMNPRVLRVGLRFNF